MRALALVLCAALPGCIAVEEETRTELGPRLERFEKSQVVEGGVKASASARWPQLELSFEGYQVCRTLSVEKYQQDQVTERHAPGAGATLSLGIASTLAGAVLLAVTPALSGEPNRQVLDGAGRYGASTRQIATAWSVATFVLGAPALAAGIIGLVRSRDSVEHGTTEQVVGQKDEPCQPHAVDGPVALLSEGGTAAPGLVAEGGKVVLQASALTGDLTTLTFHGREVELSPEARATVEGFSACARLERTPAGAFDAVRAGRLVERLEWVRACRAVRPEAMAVEAQPLEAELTKRRERDEPDAFRPGDDAASFEEAVAARTPSLRFAVGAPDLVKLARYDGLLGQSAVVEGVVEAGVAPNIGVVAVGAQKFFVVLPAKASWLGDYPAGATVEAVVVLGATQTLGTETWPVVRAVFMRAKKP